MKKYHILTLVILTLASSASSQDVVFLFVDDVSRDKLNNANTPNLNRMAQQGIKYLNAWTTPKCSPSRANFLTGRLARHHGVWDNGGIKYPARIHSTIAAKLPADWNTGVFGKWNIPFDPAQFKRRVIWESNSTDTNLHDLEDSATGSRFKNPAYSIDGVLQNGIGLNGPEVFTQAALDYADESRGSGKRFFIYHPTPLGHGTRSKKYPRPPTYNETPSQTPSIREIDRIIGRWMDWIETNGNAILIFATDNPGANEGKSEMTHKGCEAALAIWGPGIVPHVPRANKPMHVRYLHDFILRSSQSTGWVGIRHINPFLGNDFKKYTIIEKGNLRGRIKTGSRNIKRVKLFDEGKPIQWDKRKARKIMKFAARLK